MLVLRVLKKRPQNTRLISLFPSLSQMQSFKTRSSKKDRDGKVQQNEDGVECDDNRQCHPCPESQAMCPSVSSPVSQPTYTKS